MNRSPSVNRADTQYKLADGYRAKPQTSVMMCSETSQVRQSSYCFDIGQENKCLHSASEKTYDLMYFGAQVGLNSLPVCIRCKDPSEWLLDDLGKLRRWNMQNQHNGRNCRLLIFIVVKGLFARNM